MHTLTMMSVVSLGMLYAQAPSTIAMSAPPPSAPTNVSVQVVNGANSTYYYWIVANYPIGKVITPSPVVASRGPDTFSSTQFINVGWGAQTGASSYDVLRTNTSGVPNGTTNSAVATGLTVTSFKDTIVSPSSYTLGPIASTFNGQISIDNTNSTVPVLLWTLPQINNLPVNVITFSDNTTQNTAGGGGGGSNGKYTVVTYSATPTFASTSGTVENFLITLTGNVTSSTLTVSPGKPDLSIDICQDGAGSHTFVWPTNVLNAPVIDDRAHYCTLVSGVWNGTNLNISGATLHKDDWTQIPGEVNISQASGSGITKLAPAAGSNVTITVPARTANMATQLGSTVSNNCAKFDVNGNLVDAGLACGGGGGHIFTSGFTGAGAPNIGASTSSFIAIHDVSFLQGLERDVSLTVHIAGTAQKLCVKTKGTQDNSGSLVFTLRKNAADTSVVATVAAGATQNEFCSSGTVSVVNNDDLSISVTNNATATSVFWLSTYLEID